MSNCIKACAADIQPPTPTLEDPVACAEKCARFWVNLSSNLPINYLVDPLQPRTVNAILFLAIAEAKPPPEATTNNQQQL